MSIAHFRLAAVALPAALLAAFASTAGAQSHDIHLPLEEGVYRVSLTLRGGDGGSDVNITGEARRALIQHAAVKEGDTLDLSFNVWRLGTTLDNGSELRLHPREIGTPTYDDLLSLTVFGKQPSIEKLSIEPAGEVINVFLAGDSTVTDQPGVPWSAWGAMLPSYFDDNVAVANLASSGRALRSFRAEHRLDKMLDLARPGDYVFIQFAHNDQKETGEGIGPFESYADDLRDYVGKVRDVGANPVLVTPPVRRRFDRQGKWFDTLGDYPAAMRRVAERENVPLIDLFDMSRQIVEALGPDDSRNLYVHYPAGTFEGQAEAWNDDTHFRTYGGDLLARAVINGIKSAVPDLAEHLRNPEAGIDPRHPEPLEDWDWPEAGRVSEDTPEGS